MKMFYLLNIKIIFIGGFQFSVKSLIPYINLSEKVDKNAINYNKL